MNKKLKQEFARDIIALGGIPLFILTLARVFILNNTNYFLQYFFAGTIFLILTLIFKQNYYPGLALIIAFFLSKHYNELLFTIFAIIAYIGLIYSLIYLKTNKIQILKSIFIGTISIIISLGILKLIF